MSASALANAKLYQRLALEHEQSIAILSNVADGIVAVDREPRRGLECSRRTHYGCLTEALGRTPFDVLEATNPRRAARTRASIMRAARSSGSLLVL
jgi:hypothetical protein